VNAEARAGVEQALLVIMRARHPDRVWSIVPTGERPQLLDTPAGEIGGRAARQRTPIRSLKAALPRARADNGGGELLEKTRRGATH
jgi:hypothetical protein